MTFPPEKETPPVFNREQFNIKHISTMDIVDSVATELGLELPETAPRPALIKTNQPIEDNTAQIKRELWENPMLAEKLDTKITRPTELEKKPPETPVLQHVDPSEMIIEKTIEDRGRRTEDGGLGTDDRGLMTENGGPKTDGKPKPEPTKNIQNEKAKAEALPPFRLKNTLESVPAKPVSMKLKDEDLQDSNKETGWLRVVLAFIMLIIFVSVDYYSTLHNVPTYMLAVRLGFFAMGFIFTVATAWRAAGIKLTISLIIIVIFLFHFNNNRPILSVVEKFYEHPAEAGASPSTED